MHPRRRTIGRLAEEVGVGVETIRFYERRGLLKQPRRPPDGGFRHYEDDAVRLVRYIRMARNFGLTLDEIEHLLILSQKSEITFCQAVREAVHGKLAVVRADLIALRKLEVELQAFLTDCAARGPDLPCPILAGLGIASSS